MNIASTRTALIAAVIVAIGTFLLLRIDGVDAQSACIETITSDGAVPGSWDAACLSENTPTEPTNPPSGTRYARFYTFTLSEDADITAELTSSTDTYMYLMEGTGANGTVLRENDDIVRGNTNSRISESLSAGDYTIEATTYRLTTTGTFTLTISGIPAATTLTVTPTPIPGQATPTPTPTLTPTRTPTPVSGQATPVPADVLNRLTALETVVATQQGLISTLESKITVLDSRIAMLEADSPSPTLTLTPEPTTTPNPRCAIIAAHSDLRDCEFIGGTFNGLNLTGVDFTGAHLEDADFTRAILIGANFTNAIVTRARLIEADLGGANLTGADFRHSELKDANLDKATIVGTIFRSGNRQDDSTMFRGAKLTNLVFDPGSKLTQVGFLNADLSHSSFINVDMQHADFRGSIVTGVDFSGTDLRNARMGA